MATTAMRLRPINAQIWAVHTASGEHVGSFKRISGVWKFKAIGYDALGQVVPGGGPLTAQHNRVFAVLDGAELLLVPSRA